MCGVLGGNGVATEERPRGEDALSISFPVVRRKCGSRSSLTAPLPGEQTMARVRVPNFTILLDGYRAGPDPTRADPLGVSGEAPHAWLIPTRAFPRIDGN